MTKLISIARALHNDEDGAAFVEYTVLLGVILAVSIATIATVGGKASAVWTTLNTNLP